MIPRRTAPRWPTLPGNRCSCTKSGQVHPEAAYWAVLADLPPEDSQSISGLLAAWHAKGKRSVHDLFEAAPRDLAEALDVPVEKLDPIVRLRPRLPQSHRLIARLARDRVELVTLWERRYPSQPRR